jgi:YD repeat-containing protein
MRYPDGLQHHFDAAGLLVAHEDLAGHRIEVLRDGVGRISEV